MLSVPWTGHKHWSSRWLGLATVSIGLLPDPLVAEGALLRLGVTLGTRGDEVQLDILLALIAGIEWHCTFGTIPVALFGHLMPFRKPGLVA
jgi:hypothetical protein